MRRLLVVLLALAALAAPAAALAHPLGNFTVNRFSRVLVSGDRIYVRYVLDLAEIPTYQARPLDARAYAKRIGRGATLTVGGRRARLTPIAQRLTLLPGAGGLETARLEVVLEGPRLAGPAFVVYTDNNFGDRIGWKEIVVGTATASRSDELRAYPAGELDSPPDVTTATARLAPREGPAVAPTLAPAVGAAPERGSEASGFEALVGRGDLGFLVVLVSLALAFFWGAVHALSPGHGKAIVTAYLVGRRGTPRHAFLLGGITTLTHTIGVFALGGVTLALSQWIVPETLYPWLNLAAGLLVVSIGATVLWSRARVRIARALDIEDELAGHEHRHWPFGRRHSHAHPHDHHHGGDGLSRRSLVAVGISGGLLPCPSALVVLLGAISLHRVGFGLLLIVAFSLGLAATITGIGLVAVWAKRVFARATLDGPLVRALPALSALVIVLAGVAMTLRALPKVS